MDFFTLKQNPKNKILKKCGTGYFYGEEKLGYVLFGKPLHYPDQVFKVERFFEIAISQAMLGNFLNIAYRRNYDYRDVFCCRV